MIAELMNTGCFRIIRMSVRRLCLMILLLVIGCQQLGVGAEKPVLPIERGLAEAKLDKQLKINRDALLKGLGGQMRVDAATVMLFSRDPQARKILIDTLEQSENSAARIAVCKALSLARAEQKSIGDKDDFIQPLLEILSTDDSAVAELAAEATLIFEYEQISEQLEKMVTNTTLPVKARLNAIYALKLQPDMRAIFRLMELLDDSESQVSADSEKALHSLGIPVGKNTRARKQIIDELKRKGRDEFLRDWLIRQEAQMQKLEAELDMWRKMYLSALGSIYDSISEDASRGQFLEGHLNSSKVIVRLWALEKVSQWRVGTKSKLPAELGPALLNLISDRDRDVRLKTARLLSLMGELDSAQPLLEQFKLEQDDEVSTELFVALGGACYYASLPNSGIKISPETRKQTLEWAAEYLFEQDTKKVQKGAEVIKKLLEQDGLAPAEVDRYLNLLVERYNQQKDQANGVLRGELLSAMAGLCAQSVYSADSIRLFRPLFAESLRDEADLVREAAVEGLIYIDKARALKMLRKDFVSDKSIIVKKKLIDLAGEVGGAEDLVWLAEKVGTTAESELAWQTMLKIFKRSDTVVLEEWLGKFDPQGIKVKLSDEQRLSFLEIAERKAVGDNKLEMLKIVQEAMAQLYSESGKFEKAAEYLGMLRQDAQSDEENERILASLLDVYLRWPNVEAAAQLVDNSLLERDLGSDDVIIRTIDDYLSNSSVGADPNELLRAFSNIEADDRPIWAEQLKRWTGK